MPYLAISPTFCHREVQKDCQNRKREIGYMPLENCPFLKTAYLNHCFPCGYGSNPTKKGEKAVNVSFVITVRHVFVVFGNVGIRNPECGIDSIRIPRQSWDEYVLIMNARLMRGISRQEDKRI